MITEKEMLTQLREGRVQLPPLTFRFLNDQPEAWDAQRIDAHIEAKWQGKSARFAVKCKTLSTPKFFQDCINFLKSLSLPKNSFPMLFMPFLNEQQLERLPGSQTDRFPNLELLETEDEPVYFDVCQEDGFWWASPLQVYMELMAGDKRDQEIAEQLKPLILNSAGVLQK